MSHELTRRDFLKAGTAGAIAAALTGCQRAKRWVALEPYVRPPEEQLTGVATWYASTCGQCPAGCGIVVRVMNGRARKIEGNPEHPLNRGKLCARGQAGLQLLYNPDRLRGPVRQAVRGLPQFTPIDWNEGLNTLYEKLNAARGQIAIWVDSSTSGHLVDLFTLYADAVGAPPPIVFDLYSSLNGMDTLSTASDTLFGQAALPGYDYGSADVILSFGANFLGSWLSPVRYGLNFGEFRDQGLGKRGYLVQLEPRMTITGAKADRWLPLRPGAEAQVAQAIAYLIGQQPAALGDRAERARVIAGEVDPAHAAEESDLPLRDLKALAELFATTDRPVAIPGSGPGWTVEATNSVQMLNTIAGLPVEGSGLSLSADVPGSAFSPVRSSSLADVQEALGRMRSGEVQVLLTHGADPLYELPDSFNVGDALASVPFIVSFSPMIDDTSLQADLFLPDHTYLEGWGYTVVSPNFGLPMVSSRQPVVTPVFDTQATADILLTAASGIPGAKDSLPWADEAAFVKERITSLGPGAPGGTGDEVLWARFRQHGGWWPAGRPTVPTLQPAATQLPAASSVPAEGSESDYPLTLHVYLSNLLGGGSGANLPWLQGSPDTMTTIAWQSWVEINPDAAAQIGVTDGDIVQIESPHGTVEAPVYVSPAVRPDVAAMPSGQGHQAYGRYAQKRGVNPVRLLGVRQAGEGETEWTLVRVKITPTGGRMRLAVLESTVGVREGFINANDPG